MERMDALFKSVLFHALHTPLVMIYMAVIFVVLFFCTKRKRRQPKRSKSNSNKQRKGESQSSKTKPATSMKTSFNTITPDEGQSSPVIVHTPVVKEAVETEADHKEAHHHSPSAAEANIEDETSDINEDDVETSIKQNTHKENSRMADKVVELIAEKKRRKKSVTFNEEVQIKSDTEIIGNDVESVIASGKDEIISPSLKPGELDDGSRSQKIREGFSRLYKASVFSPKPAPPTGNVPTIPQNINQKSQKSENSQKRKAKQTLNRKNKKS